MLDNSPAQSQPRQPTLSGAVGIVLVPDAETQRVSRMLASELLGGHADFVLGNGDLPHLTLYHGKVSKAPTSEIGNLTRGIAETLVGSELTLRSLGFAGGNFLFWDVDWGSDSHHHLRNSHDRALTLAQYLDKGAPAKAVSEEGLKLTAEELSNIERYGHPWVGALYRPHITLGFGVGLETKVNLPRNQEYAKFTVAGVHLARIGFPGRVEEVLE